MNPFHALAGIVKGVFTLAFSVVALPFAIVFFAFQIVWVLTSWVVSAAAAVLSLALILVVLGAVVWGLKQADRGVRSDSFSEFVSDFVTGNHVSRRNGEAVDRYRVRSYREDESSDGRHSHHELGSVMVGPFGSEIRLRQLRSGLRQLEGTRIEVSTLREKAMALAEASTDGDIDFDFESKEACPECREEACKDCAEECDSEECSDGDAETASSSLVGGDPSGEAASEDLPSWIGEVNGGDDQFALAECGPFETKAACEAAFRDAVDTTVRKYVQDHVAANLAALNLRSMPWHRSFVDRTAARMQVRLRREFLQVYPLTIGDQTQNTYLKYGLLEFPQAARDRLDREIIGWARSYQVGSAWTALLGSLAAVVIALKLELPRRLSGRWFRRGPKVVGGV